MHKVNYFNTFENKYRILDQKKNKYRILSMQGNTCERKYSSLAEDSLLMDLKLQRN